MICWSWCFNHDFKFQNVVCNCCHHLTILCPSISCIAIIALTIVDYRFIILDISKSDEIHLVKNSVLDNRGCIKNAHQRNE